MAVKRQGDFITHRGLNWYDTTSYSRGQERVPACWTADVGELSVTVLTNHIYHRGEWVSHCRPFWDTWPTGAVTREEAMDVAIERLRHFVNGIVSDMPAKLKRR